MFVTLFRLKKEKYIFSIHFCLFVTLSHLQKNIVLSLLVAAKNIRHYLISISAGNVVNKPDHGTLDWVKICEKSSKVITFIDLAGHERYLKTTVFGMTGHAPDFGMLMV